MSGNKGQVMPKTMTDAGYSQINPQFDVLVVDDDPLFIKLISAILQPAGFLVHACGCGQSALNFIEKNSEMTLVLLDISIPDGSGFYVLEKLARLKQQKGFRICMVSGRSDPFALSRALTVGADDYFVKGLEPTAILTKVRSIVEADDYQVFYSNIEPAIAGVGSYARGRELPVRVTGVSRLGFRLESSAAWALHSYLKFHSQELAAMIGMDDEMFLKVKHSRGKSSGDYEVFTEIIGLSHGYCQMLDTLADQAQVVSPS